MEVDIRELIEFIASVTGNTEEEIDAFLDAEMEYLETHGVVADPEEENPELYADGPDEDAPVIDQEDLENFVAEKTGIPVEAVSIMSVAELYFQMVILEGREDEVSFEDFKEEFL